MGHPNGFKRFFIPALLTHGWTPQAGPHTPILARAFTQSRFQVAVDVANDVVARSQENMEARAARVDRTRERETIADMSSHDSKV